MEVTRSDIPQQFLTFTLVKAIVITNIVTNILDNLSTVPWWQVKRVISRLLADARCRWIKATDLEPIIVKAGGEDRIIGVMVKKPAVVQRFSQCQARTVFAEVRGLRYILPTFLEEVNWVDLNTPGPKLTLVKVFDRKRKKLIQGVDLAPTMCVYRLVEGEHEQEDDIIN